MPQAIHANARTTPRIRKEIQEAPATITNAELARRYGVHRHTMAFVAVLLMGFAREALRSEYTAQVGYSIFDYKLNIDWGSTILFFATFLGGMVVLAYPAAVAYHAGKSDVPLTEDKAEGLGKVAYALPIIWFMIVAGLGVFISVKNGTLF